MPVGVTHDPHFNAEAFMKPHMHGKDWDYQLELLDTGVPVPVPERQAPAFKVDLLPNYDGTQEHEPLYCIEMYRYYAARYGLYGTTYAHLITAAMSKTWKQRINLLPTDQRNSPSAICKYLMSTYKRENSTRHYATLFKNLRLDAKSGFAVHFERLVSLSRQAFPTERGIETSDAKQRILEQFMYSIQNSGAATNLDACNKFGKHLETRMTSLILETDNEKFLEDVRNIISVVESMLAGKGYDNPVSRPPKPAQIPQHLQNRNRNNFQHQQQVHAIAPMPEFDYSQQLAELHHNLLRQKILKLRVSPPF